MVNFAGPQGVVWALTMPKHVERESRCGAARVSDPAMMGAFKVIPTLGRYLHFRHERLLGAISGHDS